MVLKSVGVLSCGKTLGIIYALLGLIVGGFMALASMSGMFIPQGPNAGNNMIPFMAVGAAAVVFVPVAYGIMGFIGGIIVAALYNLVAGLVGGIEMEFESRAPGYPAA